LLRGEQGRKGNEMRELMLMMILLGMSGSAPAAWEKFELDGDGNTVYLDTASIRRHGNTVKVYALIDSRKAETVGDERYLSIKAEIELDCVKNLVRVAYLSVYTDKMGTGTIVKFGKVDDEPEPIEVGSPSAALSELACNQR
jgi:hypothetical protein